ncbi:hypothetical protein EBQ74_11640 [bacterium]|nr:hypothetical protein [bacterium]
MNFLGEPMRRAMVAMLIFFQVLPHSIFALNAPTTIRSLSVNKTGKWNTEQEAGYPELVKRVQKWIENIDALDVKLSPSFQVVSNTTLETDRLRLGLMEATERVRRAMLVAKDSETLAALKNEMTAARKRVAGQGDFGPEIQRAWVTEAAYHWMLKKFDAARSALERAIRIHPEGKIAYISDWDDQTGENFAIDAFEGFVAQVKSNLLRSCELNLHSDTLNFQVKINGFPSGRGTSVKLVPGDIHHLEVRAPGYNLKKEKVACEGPGKKTIFIALKKEQYPSLAKSAVTQMSHQLKSMILIEPRQDEFKLILYTPGREFDEIPTKYPIKLADLGSEFGGSTGPIATDAAIAVFEKHKLLALDLRPLAFDSQAEGSFNYQVEKDPTEKPWFKSPIFWGIVGGIALGGAITYFANRNKINSTSSDWE